MFLAHNVNDGLRTGDIEISLDVTFDSMLLTDNTLKGLKNSGFYKPSPIQLHGIPLGKCGFDIFLEAKSGTGKTAVFTVIALEKLDLNKGLQSVMLAPTREIAAQISDVIKQIGSSYEGLNVEVVMGGLPVEADIEKFKKKVHILVGSPGRMRHLIQNKHIEVSAVRLLVLDEADKLMDKSFQADINYIFSVLPKQKQVIMSSATYPDTLKSIMQNYVQKAQHICPDSSCILLGIKQLVTTVQSNINIVRQTQYKFAELLKILSSREFKQCLIFCNYQVRVGELCKMLTREKWPAEQLHGQLDQTDRLDALKTLQEYKCRILVSTDLAARGIDASNVDLVINFEPPFEWQTYLHRIGRAGRFGSYGIAITILSEGKEKLKFKEMVKNINVLPNLNNLWDNHKFELDESNTNCNPKQKTIQPILPKTQSEKEIYKIIDKDICQASEPEKCKTFEIITIDEKQKVEAICEKVKLDKILNISEIEKMCKLLEIDGAPKDIKNDDINCNELAVRTGYVNVRNNEVNDNFGKMLYSTEKSDLKIETFDDLMASFKSHEPTNYEDTENNDAVNTNFDPILHNEMNILEFSTDTFLIQMNSEEGDSNHDYKASPIANTMRQFMEPSKENIATNCLINANLNQESPSKDNYCNGSEIACQNALKEAGLPTSFGSKKNENHGIKPLKNNECMINKQKSNNTKNKKTNNKSNAPLNRSKLYEETNLKSSSEESLESCYNDTGYNTYSWQNNGSTKYMHCNKKEGHRELISESEMYNESIEVSADYYKIYNAWYTQMKSHIKHVEMSLYIQELSKL